MHTQIKKYQPSSTIVSPYFEHDHFKVIETSQNSFTTMTTYILSIIYLNTQFNSIDMYFCKTTNFIATYYMRYGL